MSSVRTHRSPSKYADLTGEPGHRGHSLSVGGRARTRQSMLRRAALIAGGLVVVALLLLLTGHWILGVIVGVVAAVAVWVYLQARAVR